MLGSQRTSSPGPRSAYALAVACIPLVICLPTGAQIAQGPDFQVNSYTTYNQRVPSVAMDPDGGFVVVWYSFGSDGSDTSSYSIQTRRFDAGGNPLGAEVQVNSYTTGNQRNPSIALDPDGAFVVVWESYGSNGGDNSSYSIQARRFDASGNPLGAEVQVNSSITGRQTGPAVAMDPDGAFVVAWASDVSNGNDTSFDSVQAQRFDVSGNPLGAEFQVNSYTTYNQFGPAVAMDPDGAFVIAWSSYDSDIGGVHAQRFDASGSPLGTEFQVNSYTTSSQSSPAVAMDPDGDFVVAWDSFGSNGSDASDSSIQAQRFDASGNPLGAEFQVNSYTTGNQSFPAVAMDPDGDFVVVWEGGGSNGTDGFGYSIQAQRFDASGNPLGTEFQVNSYTTNDQLLAAVTMDPNGDFVVAWNSEGSNGSDTSYESIQARRFRVTSDIGDRVWADLDFDGLQDVGETGVVGVSVRLYDSNSSDIVRTAETDANGAYEVAAKPGTYYLEFEEPPEFSFAPQDVGDDDSLDSDAAPLGVGKGQTIDFVVTPGVDQSHWDAGLSRGVGDRVWLDDGDGIRTEGEPGIANVTVNLYSDSEVLVDTTTTDADGRYGFAPEPGTYYLEVILPPDRAFAPSDQGNDDTTDSDFLQGEGATPTFSLTLGQVDTTWDAGLEPAAIGNFAWFDLNGDGLQQPQEPGAQGVTVRLLDDQEAVVDTAITDSDGIYQFFGVPTGTYQVEFELPVGYAFAAQGAGGNPLIDSDVDPGTGRTDPFAYTAATARRSHDAGLVAVPIFADGFESGDTSAWQ